MCMCLISLAFPILLNEVSHSGGPSTTFLSVSGQIMQTEADKEEEHRSLRPNRHLQKP